MNDVRIYLDRQKEESVSTKVSGLRSKERNSHIRSLFEPGAVSSSLLKRSKLQRLGQKLRDKVSHVPST